MLPLLLLPPLLPHPPLAFVPVPAWVFRLELVSGIFGFASGVSVRALIHGLHYFSALIRIRRTAGVVFVSKLSALKSSPTTWPFSTLPPSSTQGNRRAARGLCRGLFHPPSPLPLTTAGCQRDFVCRCQRCTKSTCVLALSHHSAAVGLRIPLSRDPLGPNQ